MLYESGCEAHATDNGGSVVFEQAGGHWVFKGFEPGMQAGSCVTIAKDDRQDLLVCLNGHMGQGIMETGVALMKFTAPAHGIGLSVDMLLRAEESSGAFGANTVTCKERPPRYFEFDKLKAGPRPMAVSVEASWADAETFRTACGKGFASSSPEAIRRAAVPGDALDAGRSHDARDGGDRSSRRQGRWGRNRDASYRSALSFRGATATKQSILQQASTWIASVAVASQ